MSIERKIIPNFLNIPYKLIIDSGLSPLDLKVYGIVLWFKNTTKLKKCFVKNATIAQLLSSKDRKISEGSVQSSLTRLEKTKYIKKLYIDKFKNHRKEIIPLYIKTAPSNEGANRELPHQMKGLAPSNEGALAPSNDGHSNNNKSNKYIDISTHTSFSKKILLKILKWYSYTISKKATSEKLVLTNKAKKVISEALEDYGPLDLLLAVKGFSDNAWQMENNGFRGAEWFFSDSKRLSQYIGLFNKNRQDSFIKQAEKFLND